MYTAIHVDIDIASHGLRQMFISRHTAIWLSQFLPLHPFHRHHLQRCRQIVYQISIALINLLDKINISPHNFHSQSRYLCRSHTTSKSPKCVCLSCPSTSARMLSMCDIHLTKWCIADEFAAIDDWCALGCLPLRYWSMQSNIGLFADLTFLAKETSWF